MAEAGVEVILLVGTELEVTEVDIESSNYHKIVLKRLLHNTYLLFRNKLSPNRLIWLVNRCSLPSRYRLNCLLPNRCWLNRLDNLLRWS